MKKYIFIILPVVALFFSCGSDDGIPDPKPGPGGGEDVTFTLSSEDARVTVSEDGKNAVVYLTMEAGTVVMDINSDSQWMYVLDEKDENGDISSDWCTVRGTTSRLNVTLKENANTWGRSTRVTFLINEELVGTLTVNQEGTEPDAGKYQLRIADDHIEIDEHGGTVIIDVATNLPSWIVETAQPDWLEISHDDETITLKASENYTAGDSRDITLKVCGEGENSSVVQYIKVKQTNPPMIFEFTVNNANSKLVIPLWGKMNCTIDWGDGTFKEDYSKSVSGAGTMISHTFEEPGVYKVSVTGSVPQLNSSESNTRHITKFIQWGHLGLESMEGAFYGCMELTTMPKDTYNTLSKVTNFNSAFAVCRGLVTLPEHLFETCDEALDFGATFMGCTSLTGIPENLFANCKKAVRFSSTFNECDALKVIPEKLFANCPEVTTFSYVFYDCPSLESIPEKIFANNPKVVDFDHVLGKTALKSIPENLFANNPNVENFYLAFWQCYELTSIPENLFAKNPNVTTFQSVFNSCTGLTSVPEKLFANNGKVTEFRSAFYGCSSLSTIPVGIFANCPLVTSFNGTFQGTAITTVPAGLFDNNPLAQDFYGVFQKTTVKSVPATIFHKNTEATTFQNLFNECAELQEIPADLFKYNTKAQVFNFAFMKCTTLKTVPVGLFDNCTEAQNFYSTFNGCSSIESIPVTLFDNCNKGISFAYTFSGCTSWRGESPYTMVDGKKVHLYEREQYPELFSPIGQKGSCFNACTGITDYEEIQDNYSNWL